MISFICCSIRPDEAEAVRRNIAETIGSIPFEFIPFDNREFKYGICKVYNLCAEKAKYDNLCFLHEDVEFTNKDWGALILAKLSEPKCGAIGFAGGQICPNIPAWWGVGHNATYINVVQGNKETGEKDQYLSNHINNDFINVITLDGLAIFVRKDVWAEFRFDEETFREFHCYDIDFALSVSQRYLNYVCFNVGIIHYSRGSYSKAWENATMLYHEKWSSKLPIYTSNWSGEKLRKELLNIEFSIIKSSIKMGYHKIAGYSEAKRYIRDNNKTYLAWKLYVKCLIYKYINKHE